MCFWYVFVCLVGKAKRHSSDKPRFTCFLKRELDDDDEEEDDDDDENDDELQKN